MNKKEMPVKGKGDDETILEMNEIVIRSATEINNLIIDKIEKFNPSEKWLIYSRIVNYLFQQHYMAAIANTAKIEMN